MSYPEGYTVVRVSCPGLIVLKWSVIIVLLKESEISSSERPVSKRGYPRPSCAAGPEGT